MEPRGYCMKSVYAKTYTEAEVSVLVRESYDSGRSKGYEVGYSEGYDDGYDDGHTEGYAEGYSDRHIEGYDDTHFFNGGGEDSR